MAHSGSNPAESLVEPLEESFAFSDDAVASLQKVLPDLVFLESEKVLDQFRCKSCRRIALRPHVTNCRHLLCGPCFEESSRKNCPVAGCPNTTILDEGKKKTETQHGLLKLRVRCLHYEYGCEEVFPLQFLLDHKPICKFRKENLLPKMWTPNVLKDHHYIEQLQRDLNHLREAFNVLKAEVILIKKELLQKTEQLLQVQHNEKGFVSDITLIQEQLVILENLQGTDIKKLIKDAIVEQLNPLKEVLKKDVHDYLKIVTDQHRVDIITEISSGLTRQLVKDEALLENNLFDKVKSENIEMLTKHIKELEEKIQMQSEEISTSMKNAYSEECQKMGDHFNEFISKITTDHGTFKQEFDEKFDKYQEIVNSIKSEMNDIFLEQIKSYLSTMEKSMQKNISMEISSELKRQMDKDEVILENRLLGKIQTLIRVLLKEDAKENEKIIRVNLNKEMTENLNQHRSALHREIEDFRNQIQINVQSIKEEYVKRSECDLKMNRFQSQLNATSKKLKSDLSTMEKSLQKNVAMKISSELKRPMDEADTRTSLPLKEVTRENEKGIFQQIMENLNPYRSAHSLNHMKMESELEAKRTEFVWKVHSIRSLVERWKKEGKGHVLSEVFITKEFGFKIRAKSPMDGGSNAAKGIRR